MDGDQLPAILATAEVALTASTRTPAATRSALSLLRRTSFVHHQCPPHQCTPVAGLHGLSGSGIIVYFDEPKSSCLTTETIAQDIHAVDMNTRFVKKRLQVGFGSLVGQIAYEQLCH
jgi:hypothetical protein